MDATVTAIIALVVVIVGLLLIVIGTWVSLVDWNDRRKPKAGAKAAAPGAFETRAESLSETLTGLAKVFDSIARYPLGMRLVLVGVVLIVLGGFFASVSNLVASL